MTNNSTPHRKLGKYGPEIPALGFGVAVLSFAYGTPPEDEERFKVLDRALELGATHWDTADFYGDNEDLLAKWFKRTGKRDFIFLATKFGILRGATTTSETMMVDSSAQYCKKACEQSLKRLGVDTIDLYYAHRVNRNTPIEETMRAMAELKVEGKIRYIGLSEISSSTLRRACKIAHVDAVQMEYSPFVLNIERHKGTDLLATCRELGVAVVAFSPLGRGLLTGALTTRDSVSQGGDIRKNFPWFSNENLDKNVRLVNHFKEMATKRNCTSSQLALAWLMKQGSDILPIPGTKRIKCLEENWGALDIELSDDDEAEIRRFLETADIAGGRAGEDSLAMCYADTVDDGTK